MIEGTQHVLAIGQHLHIFRFVNALSEAVFLVVGGIITMVESVDATLSILPFLQVFGVFDGQEGFFIPPGIHPVSHLEEGIKKGISSGICAQIPGAATVHAG
jgi:hypothetical protein